MIHYYNYWPHGWSYDYIKEQNLVFAILLARVLQMQNIYALFTCLMALLNYFVDVKLTTPLNVSLSTI